MQWAQSFRRDCLCQENYRGRLRFARRWHFSSNCSLGACVGQLDSGLGADGDFLSFARGLLPHVMIFYLPFWGFSIQLQRHPKAAPPCHQHSGEDWPRVPITAPISAQKAVPVHHLYIKGKEKDGFLGRKNRYFQFSCFITETVPDLGGPTVYTFKRDYLSLRSQSN